MMALDMKKQIVKKLLQHNVKSIAIAMHNSPDGDAIGSAVSLEKALLKIGKKVDIIIHNKISAAYSKIIGSNRVNKIIIPPHGKIYDVVILVDCADLNRTFENIVNISKFMICIDHHYGCDPVGDLYLYERTASTGIIVYKIIKMITPIDKEIANALYLTIRSDTCSFKNSNTDVKAHEIAGDLLFQGADLQTINEIYENKSLSLLKLMGHTFMHIFFDRQYGIIYLIVKDDEIKKAQSNYEEASTLIDYIRTIEGAEIAFLFIESNNNITIKARSKYTNVAEIMANFQGGGHMHAAGALVYGEDIYFVVESVIRRARDCINNTVNKEGANQI